MRLERRGAALLTVAFLVAQLIGLVHQSTARHSVCPEHGELIHGRVVAGSLAGRGTEARRVPQAPQGDHDACELAVASHQRTQPPDPPQAFDAAPEAQSPVAPPPAREVVASLALYRTAPKTSPPA